MFQLTPNPTFPAKVKIPVPGGAVQILELEFKYLPRKEFLSFVKKMEEAVKNKDDDKGTTLLFSVIKGWNVDADLNRKNFDRLSDNYPFAAIEIYLTYLKEINRAKAGN